MSPEQVTGQDIDWRSDIYALGAVAYEMLAGQPPFTGRSVQTVLGKVISDEPRPLAEHRKSVPPHVGAAIARSLEKLPADRWQTAADFAEALAGKGFRPDRSAVASKRALIPWTLAALLALFTFTGVITIAPLFALTLGLGAANAVNQPARLALIPNLVASASLPSAVAINSLIFNGARFLGPAAAGLVIEHGGFALAFAVNSASYLAFIAALARIEAAPDEEAPRRMLRRTPWRDTFAGYSYALQHPGIGGIIALRRRRNR